jgi:hypothetical protein
MLLYILEHGEGCLLPTTAALSGLTAIKTAKVIEPKAWRQYYLPVLLCTPSIFR